MSERHDRTCAACDHARHVGPRHDLQCWAQPPQPCFVGMEPSKLAGQPPRPVVIPVVAPTWPWYSCPKWEERKIDHPDLAVPTDAASEPLAANAPGSDQVQ